MRGVGDRQMAMPTTVSPEDLIPAEHSDPAVRSIVGAVLAELGVEFEVMYARFGTGRALGRRRLVV